MLSIYDVFNLEILDKLKVNSALKNILVSLIDNIQTPGLLSVDIADLEHVTAKSSNVLVLFENTEFCMEDMLNKGIHINKPSLCIKSIWVDIYFGDSIDDNRFAFFLFLKEKVFHNLPEHIDLILTDSYKKGSIFGSIAIVAFD